MKIPINNEHGISVLEMIIALTVISSISVIIIVMIETYNRNFNVYKISNEYYSEKLKVSLCFNQVLYFYNNDNKYILEMDNDNFVIKNDNFVFIEYIDGSLYNVSENMMMKFKYIKDINVIIENYYLKIELVCDEFTDVFRVRWNQGEC